MAVFKIIIVLGVGHDFVLFFSHQALMRPTRRVHCLPTLLGKVVVLDRQIFRGDGGRISPIYPVRRRSSARPRQIHSPTPVYPTLTQSLQRKALKVG